MKCTQRLHNLQHVDVQLVSMHMQMRTEVSIGDDLCSVIVVWATLPCLRAIRREYKEAWESDPFLTAGGDCKVSKRPKENFGEFFAREHALLALEREAYIKGRGSLLVDDDDTSYL